MPAGKASENNRTLQRGRPSSGKLLAFLKPTLMPGLASSERVGTALVSIGIQSPGRTESCEGLRPSQEMGVMKSKAEKVLVVESDEALREQVVAVLSDAGYEMSTEYAEGMKAILAFGPDAVVLGADPPQLDCCDLLSQIKGSEHTQ